MDAAEQWWEWTYGPHKTIVWMEREIETSRVVLLCTPYDLAYRHEMRDYVVHNWRASGVYRDLEVCEYDCADQNAELPFEQKLLEWVAPDDCSYRKNTESVVDFINRKMILSDKVIWIKGVVGQRDRDDVLRFAVDYARKGREGFIVVELAPELISNEFRTLPKIGFEISEIDMEAFAQVRLREWHEGAKIPHFIYRYLTLLTTSLCKTDAELAELFIRRFYYETDEPESVLRMIFEDGDLPSSREKEKATGETQHIFYVLRHKRKDEISRLIWSAQIQGLFPVLENLRRLLIERYFGFWEKALFEVNVCEMLPDESGKHERIFNPWALELGQMKYCLNNVKDSSAVSETDNSYLQILPQWRHKLAHLEVLTADDIKKLSGIVQQFDDR